MAVIDIVVFVGGIALGIWQHDNLVKFWQGGEAFVKNLEAKIASIKAKL